LYPSGRDQTNGKSNKIVPVNEGDESLENQKFFAQKLTEK
jgi:hypothetical protein